MFVRTFTAKEFFERREKTPHWPNTKGMEIFVSIPDEDGNMRSTPCKLLLVDTMQEKFIVQTDYTCAEKYIEGYPSESDYWLAGVPYKDCGIVIIVEPNI